MRTTVQWIDAVKKRHGLESDYAVAKLLDVGQSQISHYRMGRSTMDVYMAARVAQLLELEPIQVIASAEAERARDAGKKDFWKRQALQRFTVTARAALDEPEPDEALYAIAHALYDRRDPRFM